MINYLKFLAYILLVPLVIASQDTDESKTSIDSLEEAQVKHRNETKKIQLRIDSLNAIVRNEYIKKGLSDTIVGEIERDGIAYQQPDILSKKIFSVEKGEIIVIIGFNTEWFKIIHKKGIGFLLDKCIKHDDKIYNYKSIQLHKNSNKKEK